MLFSFSLMRLPVGVKDQGLSATTPFSIESVRTWAIVFPTVSLTEERNKDRRAIGKTSLISV